MLSPSITVNHFDKRAGVRVLAEHKIVVETIFVAVFFHTVERIRKLCSNSETEIFTFCLDRSN